MPKPTFLAAAKAPAAQVTPTGTFASFAQRTEPTAGWTIPVAPRGPFTLKPFQAAAVETALLFKHVALGHQPGMGKTPMFHAIASALVHRGPVVAVVPPSLRIDPWTTLVDAWGWPLRYFVVEGRGRDLIPGGYDLYIVGDSVLSARLEDLRRLRPVAVFGDEAHRYKNPTAQRSRAFRHLAEGTREQKDAETGKVTIVSAGFAPEYVVIGTGTLAVNRPDEVFTPVRSLGAPIMRSIAGGTYFTDYRNRWCTTKTVWTGKKNIEVVTGCKDAVGLHTALVESCYIRVERAEVGGWPNKGLVIQRMALNGALRTYKAMERDFVAWVQANKGKKAAERARKAEVVTRLMALWQAAGMAKATAAAEYANDLWDQNEPVVLFAWHREVVDTLVAGIETDTCVIKGGASSQAKADAVRAFQQGEANVIVANIEAGGEGVTLDRSANLAFAQLPWSPGKFVQASDRIYRITQRRDCLIHVLLAADTVEERVWQQLQEKAAVVDVINSGDTNVTLPDEESIIDAVLRSYGYED